MARLIWSPHVANMASYLRAEASLALSGPLDVSVVANRLSACSACVHMTRSGDLMFCSVCGCGTNARAELSIKATMPLARCPKGKWDVDSRIIDTPQED